MSRAPTDFLLAGHGAPRYADAYARRPPLRGGAPRLLRPFIRSMPPGLTPGAVLPRRCQCPRQVAGQDGPMDPPLSSSRTTPVLTHPCVRAHFLAHRLDNSLSLLRQ